MCDDLQKQVRGEKRQLFPSFAFASFISSIRYGGRLRLASSARQIYSPNMPSINMIRPDVSRITDIKEAQPTERTPEKTISQIHAIIPIIAAIKKNTPIKDIMRTGA